MDTKDILSEIGHCKDFSSEKDKIGEALKQKVKYYTLCKNLEDYCSLHCKKRLGHFLSPDEKLEKARLKNVIQFSLNNIE